MQIGKIDKILKHIRKILSVKITCTIALIKSIPHNF